MSTFAVPAPANGGSLACDPAILQIVRAWWDQAQISYPAATCRAWRFDWAVFARHCAERQVTPLPADSATLVAFVQSCVDAQRSAATIKRYLATIRRIHGVAGLAHAIHSEPVRMALRSMARSVGVRQRQAAALGWKEIKAFIALSDTSLHACRDRALLSVAYDLLARSSELVGLRVRDIAIEANGTGRAFIERSKTDQNAEGHVAYLTRTSVKLLTVWLERSRIAKDKNGPLFRRILGHSQIGPHLTPTAVSGVYKKVARYLKLPGNSGSTFSGHSVRVGATQDLVELNASLAAVMREGRWTSERMPRRYAEKLLPSRGAIAQAAVIQGRD